MKIKIRIHLLASLAWISLLLVASLSYYSSSQSSAALAMLEQESLVKMSTLSAWEVDAVAVRGRVYEIVSKRNLPFDEQREELQRLLKLKSHEGEESQKAHLEYAAMTRGPAGEAKFQEVKRSWDVWYAAMGPGVTNVLSKALANPSPEAFDAMYDEVYSIGTQMRDTTAKVFDGLEELSALVMQIANETAAADQAASDRMTTIQIVVSLLCIAGVVFLGITTLGAVVKPVELVRNTVINLEKDSDLRLKVEYQATDEIGEMVVAFNKMVARLQESLKEIREKAESAGQAVDSVDTAARQVASSSASQSSSTSAMAASVEEMTVSINTVSASADDAQTIAQRAGENSREGGEIIARTATEMSEIAQSVAQASQVIKALGDASEQISSVVQVIKEVADQTNLLALNAAIEAARAGEQGRGFAVVADEVRKLAERTAQSTADISAMINKIQASAKDAVAEMDRVVQQVESGQILAKEAGERIISIRDEANRVSDAVTEISNALKEQSQASQEISKHVESIAQMTDENNAAAEEAASSSGRMKQLAGEVVVAAARFKI